MFGVSELEKKGNNFNKPENVKSQRIPKERGWELIKKIITHSNISLIFSKISKDFNVEIHKNCWKNAMVF